MPLRLNGSTGITGIDGSNTTPSLTGSRADSGITFPAANAVAITTSNTEQVRIDSSGNMGIGTSTPYNKLDVVGVGARMRVADNQSTSGTLDLYANTTATYIDANYWSSAVPMIFKTGGLERARIDSSGNMSIGTSGATGRLAIAQDPTVLPHISTASGITNINNASNVSLANASGMIMIVNVASGEMGIYLVGGGQATFLGSSFTTATTWVTPTTSPASGKACIAWSGTNYRIYNNIGSTLQTLITFISPRNSV